MNCAEAEIYVSALNDGEQVPPIAAQHIAACESCQRILNDYSRMGTELRLAASIEPAQLPSLKLPARTKSQRFDFWRRRVTVPRFALAALIACLVLATAAVSLVQAQSKPLWFEFGVGFQKGFEIFHYTVAKAGYNNIQAPSRFVNGAPRGVVLRVKIESLSADDVVLRCRAVPAPMGITATGIKLGYPKGRVPLDAAPRIHYKPGEALAIPIESGGTVYLKGEVLDNQPKLAFGVPLVPAARKLIVRSPILVTSNKVLGDMDGATAIASNEGAIRFLTGSNGTYLFALHPFPGAVQGKLDWGEITFKLDNNKYRLVAAAPMAGGDQPRPVWVRHNPQPVTEVALGAGPIPK